MKEINNLRGLLIPAGVIAGMGVGFLIDNVVAGMFIGLGMGFVILAAVAIAKLDKNQNFSRVEAGRIQEMISL